MRNIFIERVDIRLSQLKISRSDLARRLELTPQTVTQTLSRKVRPQQATLERWAKALETTPEFLMGVEGAPPTPVKDLGPTDEEQKAWLAMGKAIGIPEEKLRAIRAVFKIAEENISDAATYLEEMITEGQGKEKPATKRGAV